MRSCLDEATWEEPNPSRLPPPEARSPLMPAADTAWAGGTPCWDLWLGGFQWGEAPPSPLEAMLGLGAGVGSQVSQEAL